ncbi:MAG: 1,4-dihydroxy-2-naphthoate polyprenyltransferase [Actinobacteria bacterium]|nr:1,4-dihydroxy-2-naphthoate polyprenyltransferase [Actinomycetota bacterium]
MNKWIIGARPRTLPAAVVPVAVGAAVAVGEPDVHWWRGVLAGVVSLMLQVGVNYANDYSDGVRGTDDVRVGPARLVGGGLAPAHSVKMAAMLSFLAAAVAGLVLSIVTSPWLLVVGVASILAGWFYTGGKNPYGYRGLGELFVFVFFGLVATVGTTYVVSERITALSWQMGVAVGSLACALLVTNNLRDIATDREVAKRTLAVRLGDSRTRTLFVVLVVGGVLVGAAAAWQRGLAALIVIVELVAIRPVRRVRAGASGRELIAVLGDTAKVQLVFGVVATVTLALGA